MTNYDTKAEAEEVLEQLRKKQITLFCPLIRDNCRPDCVAFEQGCVERLQRPDGSAVWYIMYNPRCTAYMLIGRDQ